jgi:hypothetical protein
MALTSDQTAMLQLLLERGQGYGELATVLGVDEAEVRTRARSAISELAGADLDGGVGLTDYLLGQADPIGRADAVRHLREHPDDHRLATEVAAELRAMFPSAELPRLPGEPRRQRRAPRLGLGLNKNQARVLMGAGGAAVLLIVIVLAISGVFSGDDGDASPSEATTAASDGGTDETIERVGLDTVGGGNADGEAVFGLASADQPYVDLELSGLDPAPQGKTYVVWLMLSEKLGYPLSPVTVSQQGAFTDRFAIPSPVLPLIARVQSVEISISEDEELARLLIEAQRRASQPDASIADLLLEQPGEIVLAGAVPRARAGGGDAAGG